MSMKDTVAVLINIIEARDLRPRASSGMCDAVLEVNVFGDKHHTPVVKKDLSPYWNHYFHFEDRTSNFDRETLTVSVYDTATTFRKELIGSFGFELGDIYAQKNHEYFNVWVVLSNHDVSSKQGVQGYLKLSITVLKAGDVPVQHTEEEAEETDSHDENLSNMVLLKPKGLNAVESVLKAKVFKAENLPKMDKIGTCDPFVEITYANSKASTQTLKNTLNPVWNEEVQLPVTLPTMADSISVKLFDFDVGSKPELISHAYFSFKEVQANNTNNKISWKNFYSGEGQAREATDYCGRVLMNLSSTPVEGKIGSIPVPGVADPETTNYTLQFDVYECQGVDAPLYPIYVVASIGPHSVKTSQLKIKHKSADYYESVPDLDISFPSDSSQIPDLFIYVYEDIPGADKRHGYLRYSISQLANISGSPRWEALRKKSSSSKDDEHPPGFLHFRVNFGPSALCKQKPRQKIVPPTKKPYQLRAHIFAGRDLPAGDEDALSDPYCLLTISHAKNKTRTIEHTIYPDWFETLSVDIELPDQRELSPDIHLSVYDRDTLTSDEFLGRVVIPISEASLSNNLKAPKWYPLVLHNQVVGKGEILVSFQLIPSENAKSVALPDLRPRFIDTQINVGVIGLRELAPFQLIPPSNAYIKFSVPGAKPVTTKKSSKPVGNSPNYFENIVISAQLPEALDFVPALLVEVFDPRAIGKDAKIAAASVPLSGFVPWAPQTSQLPYGVHLPPVVDESAFYQLSTSGAAKPAIPSLPLQNVTSNDHTIIEIPESPEDESSTLLPKSDKGKVAISSSSSSSSLVSRRNSKQPARELSTVSRRDVPVTTIPGMEDEPEEPQRGEFASEVEHQMRSFPFLEIDLLRGSSAGISTGVFSKHTAVVGKFKGSISVKPLSGISSSSSKKAESAVIDVSKLNTPRPYVVRVYVEQGQNLVPHDANGSSDPYLVVFSTPEKLSKTKAGNAVFDRENVKPHTLQPDFYKMYELKGVLPDDNELRIQVWDKDDIGADEFIGETRYDLEMLWFSEEWRKLVLKPKEIRTLWNPLSSFPQGKLKMWIELLTPTEAGQIPPSPIGPPVREPYELRIVVWETRNVVPKDKILGKESSDQLVVTKLLSHAHDVQQTDVHDSVMDGCGKFNWRIVYHDVFLPYDTPRLKIQVYDKDAVGPNDAIAEANLNLKGFFQKGLRLKTARIGALGNLTGGNIVGLGTIAVGGGDSKKAPTSAGPYNTGQWLDLFHPSHEGPQGSICLELDLLTREEAAQKRAGDGRSEPNQNPFLPAPVRPSRKWFSDFMQFFGLDKLKKYLIIAGVVLLVILILVLIIKLA